MTDPEPVYVGAYDPIKAGDVIDLYLDISADLETGESISSVTLALTGPSGPVSGAIAAHSETATRTDFRVNAPAAGKYQLSAVFIISDGQKITREAGIRTV
jgi:hypothetical protein